MTGADESLTRLRRAVELGDVSELRALAHSLGGSAANLGALRVQSVCAELERLGAAHDLPGAARLVTELEGAVADAVRELQEPGQ